MEFILFFAGDPCPICETNKNKPVTLVPIDGTEKDGNSQAIQVHIDCIELRVAKNNADEADKMILYQLIEE